MLIFVFTIVSIPFPSQIRHAFLHPMFLGVRLVSLPSLNDFVLFPFFSFSFFSLSHSFISSLVSLSLCTLVVVFHCSNFGPLTG